MALTVTDNSVRQINAALLSLEKKIGETNSEKAQDKQVVQMELKNVQYNFMAPLHQSGISVSIDTTGTWEGNARSATNAEHAITADNIEHANTATSANLSKTLDTVNGDKLQIGSGTAQNVTNAKHAATVDTTDTVTSGSTTPITSGGVYTALNGFIKTKNITVGDITMPASNYLAVSTGLTSSDTAISAKLSSWSANSDSFSVICYGQNEVYIVAKSGTTITNVSVTVLYI